MKPSVSVVNLSEGERNTDLPADILPIRPNCDEDGIRLRDQDQIKEEVIMRGEGK